MQELRPLGPDGALAPRRQVAARVERIQLLVELLHVRQSGHRFAHSVPSNLEGLLGQQIRLERGCVEFVPVRARLLCVRYHSGIQISPNIHE